ncbi:hypothetical protein IYP50_004097 [Escherichia coli]|nr:hypothetical protein [Escherichia coli]
MSPAQAKQKQHERYEAVAVQVLRGRAGYKPAVKSRFSKSANSKFSHTIAFCHERCNSDPHPTPEIRSRG